MKELSNLRDNEQGYLFKDKMSQSQSKLYNSIKNHLNNFLMNKYERNTSVNGIYKSKTAYIIYMRCLTFENKIRCGLSFRISQDINTKETMLSFVKICDHAASKGKKIEQNEQYSAGQFIKDLEHNIKIRFISWIQFINF